MKLPVPGFISNALSSLINNDHRKPREIYKGRGKDGKCNAKLDFPEVNAEKRQKVVNEILEKRRQRTAIRFIVAIAILILVIIALKFFFEWYFSDFRLNFRN